MILPTLNLLAAQQPLTYYVSVQGNDANSGSSSAPYATLNKALSTVYHRVNSEDPTTIVVEPGRYFVSTNYYLTAPLSNLTIQGQPGAQFFGETLLTWHSLASDPFATAFTAPAQQHILVANLASQVPSSALAMLESTSSTLQMNVLEDSAPLQLAQYPAPGSWLTSASGSSGSKLAWTTTTPRNWSHWDDVWVNGYLAYDWDNVSAQLSDVNLTSGTATAIGGVPNGIYSKSRFRFLDVPEELSGPGQYYFNRSTGNLYFWPTSTNLQLLGVTTLNDPFFWLQGVDNVRITGIDFEGSYQDGLQAWDSNGVTIDHCTVNGIGRNGIEFFSCTNSTVDSSLITNCASEAVHLNGGQESTYTPSGNVLSNTTITNYAQLSPSSPAVLLDGDGNTVTHNLIGTGPTAAILSTGPKETVTYNIFQNSCTQVSDSGVVYQGTDPLARGLDVECNWFQGFNLNIAPNSRTTAQVCAVYLDNMLPGAMVRGNIFQNGNIGVIAGGGRDNSVLFNVFYGDTTGILLDARGTGWAYPDVTFGGSWHYLDSVKSALQSNPDYYAKTFPLAADFLTNSPYWPVRFNASDNVCTGTTWIDYTNGTNNGSGTYNGNVLGAASSLQAALNRVPAGYTMPSLSDIGPQ
jgi:hypothetical protein